MCLSHGCCKPQKCLVLCQEERTTKKVCVEPRLPSVLLSPYLFVWYSVYDIQEVCAYLRGYEVTTASSTLLRFLIFQYCRNSSRQFTRTRKRAGAGSTYTGIFICSCEFRNGGSRAWRVSQAAAVSFVRGTFLRSSSFQKFPKLVDTAFLLSGPGRYCGHGILLLCEHLH